MHNVIQLSLTLLILLPSICSLTFSRYDPADAVYPISNNALYGSADSVPPYGYAVRDISMNNGANFKRYRKQQNSETRSGRFERSGSEDEERILEHEAIIDAAENRLRYQIIRDIDENAQNVADAVVSKYDRGFPFLNVREIAEIARTETGILAGAMASPRYAMSATERRAVEDQVEAELEAKLAARETALRLTSSAAKRTVAIDGLADELSQQLGMSSMSLIKTRAAKTSARPSAISQKFIKSARRLSAMDKLTESEARQPEAEKLAEAEDIKNGLISPKFAKSARRLSAMNNGKEQTESEARLADAEELAEAEDIKNGMISPKFVRSVAESGPIIRTENKRRPLAGSHLSVRKALRTIVSLFREPERRVRIYASPNFLRFG